jgi:hypothetical protein
VQYQVSTLTFTGVDVCTTVPLTIGKNETLKSQVLDPAKISTLGIFYSDVINNPSCYNFTYYEADAVTTPIATPFPMTIAYPTLTVPKIAAGKIGQNASLEYTIIVKAEIKA